jgi:hypothetical protein
VAENMAVLKGRPVKAFFYQDHQAHIQVHMAAVQDPVIQQIVGQNPRAPQIQAAMMAHIAEHVAYAYRQKIEQQMGVALPPEDEKLPPQIEVALSSMMAQAAQQVLQENQAQAAQAQAQAQAQDPVIQMQMAELEIKKQEVALKEKKMATDAAAKADELELRKQEVEARMELEGFKAATTMQQQKENIAAQQEREGVRMGIDIAKTKSQENKTK